eukprot:gene8622-34065_t
MALPPAHAAVHLMDQANFTVSPIPNALRLGALDEYEMAVIVIARLGKSDVGRVVDEVESDSWPTPLLTHGKEAMERTVVDGQDDPHGYTRLRACLSHTIAGKLIFIKSEEVDAFTTEPFGGNPAAVVLVDIVLDDATMQKIAAENNLAETAFVECIPGQSHAGPDLFSAANMFQIRWFTPELEVPLCGHATLAAAAVIFSECGNKSETIQFCTRDSGTLEVSRASSKEMSRLPSASNSDRASKVLAMKMRLPLADPTDPVPQGCNDPSFLSACVGSAQVREVRYAASALKYLMVVLGDRTTREELEALKPDMQAMKKAFSRRDVHAIMVTCPGGRDYDFLSRFFAPWMGIDEDHVTGSAHTLLGPYWGSRLGKETLTARQCSARGGELVVSVDRGTSSAYVYGTAVIVVRGSMYL